MKKLRSLREVTESTIYQYNFILSRGISQDGSELEITPETMMMDIKNWWNEQGPKGYDIMQIYALKNTETAFPAVVVELDESLVLYSTIQLSDSVALRTVKAGSKGNVIKPEQVLSTLSKIKENKMNKTKMIVKRLKEDTEYQKFFQSAMKKFNINSPAELKDPTKKKDFFDYIDKNYKGKSEMSEGALLSAVKTLSIYDLNGKKIENGGLQGKLKVAVEALEKVLISQLSLAGLNRNVNKIAHCVTDIIDAAKR